MLQELGLWSLLLLSLLLPEAQSARVRFFDLHHHHHNLHRSQRVSSESHLQMVTMPKKKYAQHGVPNIELLVTAPTHDRHHVQDTSIARSNHRDKSQSSAAEGFNFHASMLDTPVATSDRGVNSHTRVEAGPNMGRKSVSFANMLNTPVSGPNPGGNSQSLASMLDTPVSGPNPGGNSQSLSSMLDTPISGLNLGGNLQTSGHNEGDNGESLARMLDTPDSGPNPGGNTQSFASMLNIPVSGPNPEGNSQSLLVSGSHPSGNTHSLTVSVPNFGSNMEGLASVLDTPVSGPNPGGNSETLVSMLHTPVSGPNPDGNAQSLAVSVPNPGGNSQSILNILDTPVSGPNPGGNSQVLSVGSGPNPGGNSQILSVVSGPNPGGNSQILAASSGPNPVGNSQVLATSFGTKPSDNAQSEVEIKLQERGLNIILDSPVSGPNPGGNSQNLAASYGPNYGGNSNILAVSSGPRRDEKSNIVMMSKSTGVVVDVGEHEEHVSPQTLAASSGPNHGGNTQILNVETLVASSGPNPGGNAQILAESSGPNPGRNSNIVLMSKSSGIVVDIGEHEEHISPQTLAASSGPNPSGNTQILDVETLAASSGPNPGGNAQILAASSGPNPGGNSNIVMMSKSTGVVDVREHEEHISPETLAASAGPNPSGNTQILVVDTIVASSGPNPGGNAQILAASSGPNPGGNSNIFMVSKESEMDDLKHEKSVKTHMTHMPEAETRPGKLGGRNDHTHADPYVKGIPASLAVSGPNPGGNSDILMVTGTSVNFSSHNGSKPVQVEEPNSIGVTAQAVVSGNNHAGLLGSNLAFRSNPAGNVKELSMGSTSFKHHSELDVSSEPFSEIGSNFATLEQNPGGNMRELGLSGNAQSSKEGSYADAHASHQSSMRHIHDDVSKTYTMEESSMTGATVLNELPRTPEPPSGPSPSHNSEITQQSLFANNLRRETLEGVIGCGEEKGDIDVPTEESVPSRMFRHNEEFFNIMRMGVASTKKPTS